MKTIKSALISVFSKDGLASIVKKLDELGVIIYSTGGTQKFIENLGISVIAVEELTSYPSILSGRVKTLHPKVFGGILARREPDHLDQLQEYKIPEIDLVIVDLYPFEETVRSTNDHSQIIEKIDIGGISLIRAAAKNYEDVVVIPSREDYSRFLELLNEKGGGTDLYDRKRYAINAFKVSSRYDKAIHQYLDGIETTKLRYGENPHQEAVFRGDLERIFDKLNGKPLSYNNLLDIDGAVSVMREFKDDDPTIAIMKHTNTCGLATRDTIFEAWTDALACDNQSAFGGIIISNRTIDLETAKSIDKIFYEAVIAPEFDEDAFTFLSKKSKRVIMKIKKFELSEKRVRTFLNGVAIQDDDTKSEGIEDMKTVTTIEPSDHLTGDMIFANRAVKHLKSNAIAIVKNKQLIGMGCGQTSRVDALRQAIEKAERFGFDTQGAVLSSDAFFPFADSVEYAHKVGIAAIIQPGGSIKDQDSIDYCNENGIPMVFTGTRHFKH